MGSELHPVGTRSLPDQPQPTGAAVRRRPAWPNRNVVAMSLTSFFSDAGHEMVTAALPGFLGVIGIPAGALGWIEGGSDGASSFVKLAAGWYSDRIGRRKGIVTAGYFSTGTALALFAAAASWPLVLSGRLLAWLGVCSHNLMTVWNQRLTARSLWPAEAVLRHVTTMCSWSNSSWRSWPHSESSSAVGATPPSRSSPCDSRLPCSNGNDRARSRTPLTGCFGQHFDVRGPVGQRFSSS